MSTKVERTLAIEKLTKVFSGAAGIYLADNNKISVSQVMKLRVNVRKKGMRFIVVKNSLARIAAQRSNKKSIADFFKGPTAVIVASDDVAAPARIIKDFQKENKNLLAVKAAFVDGSVFSADEVLKLADIPNREVLLAQFVGCLKQPMSRLAGALDGIITKLVGTIDAVKGKKVNTSAQSSINHETDINS
jgi:large subunit ribosomal protein L10